MMQWSGYTKGTNRQCSMIVKHVPSGFSSQFRLVIFSSTYVYWRRETWLVVANSHCHIYSTQVLLDYQPSTINSIIFFWAGEYVVTRCNVHADLVKKVWTWSKPQLIPYFWHNLKTWSFAPVKYRYKPINRPIPWNVFLLVFINPPRVTTAENSLGSSCRLSMK